MDKKKKIFILGILAIIIVGTLIFILIRNNKIKSNQGSIGSIINPVYEPEFMGADEKASLSLPADSKIQVLKTDATGKAEVYRIIRREADVVLDPSRVGEPGMTQPGNQAATK
jgi:hypothetical protein